MLAHGNGKEVTGAGNLAEDCLYLQSEKGEESSKGEH